jgi:hypothetical protein
MKAKLNASQWLCRHEPIARHKKSAPPKCRGQSVFKRSPIVKKSAISSGPSYRKEFAPPRKSWATLLPRASDIHRVIAGRGNNSGLQDSRVGIRSIAIEILDRPVASVTAMMDFVAFVNRAEAG